MLFYFSSGTWTHLPTSINSFDFFILFYFATPLCAVLGQITVSTTTIAEKNEYGYKCPARTVALT